MTAVQDLEVIMLAVITQVLLVNLYVKFMEMYNMHIAHLLHVH